ncbi:MAG: acyl carrier protein [Treponema sp.]|nr:acyl carrier protein [Treponema sp.]
MKNAIGELEEYVRNFQTAPSLGAMPRRTLFDKGINGPTGAHVIEELHTPLNLAYVTFTTGTSAFQNITGVTWEEIPGRAEASGRALEQAGLKKGDSILVSYPPLVNVFSKKGLEEYGLKWFFPEVSGRDALLLSLIKERPSAVIGESSFLRSCLESAFKLELQGELPKNLVFLAAGTPLDSSLPEAAEKIQGKVHDLYGCQEFGWLTLDGVPLRDDISLFEAEDGNHDLIAGGLPTGDRFTLNDKGHICNPDGKIITYSRKRTVPEMEVTVLETTASSGETLEKLARTILRIKARIVRTSPELKTNAEKTVLSLGPNTGQHFLINTKEKTKLFDTLLDSQLAYQRESKTDPAWIKGR